MTKCKQKKKKLNQLSSKNRYWKRFKRQELWKGGYEYMTDWDKASGVFRPLKRHFTLRRVTKSGAVSDSAKVFSSFQAAKKKGWAAVYKA